MPKRNKKDSVVKENLITEVKTVQEIIKESNKPELVKAYESWGKKKSKI